MLNISTPRHQFYAEGSRQIITTVALRFSVVTARVVAYISLPPLAARRRPHSLLPSARRLTTLSLENRYMMANTVILLPPLVAVVPPAMAQRDMPTYFVPLRCTAMRGRFLIKHAA